MKKEYEQHPELKQIVVPLLDWFHNHARVLPWRELPTPYRVWVSEIMLQQTRVEAVKPFFERFVAALPTIRDLAEAEEDQLLKLWEGLGYYNRVRNMQVAARTIMDQYDGEMPSDYEELLSLKGIGSYTAGAIASIAYGIPVPAVDGNVLRVISRVIASEEDILKQSVKHWIEAELQTVIPEQEAGAFNQALMELGAMVCVPNGMAKCEVCPLAEQCEARKRDMVMELPKKTPKKSRRQEERTVFIIQDGDRIALQKRPSRGLLAGLYEFPNVAGKLSQDEVLDWMKAQDFRPIRIRKLEPAKHVFSHIEWHMTGYVIMVEEFYPENRGYIFAEPAETQARYPIPAAYAAYTKYMDIKLGQEKYASAARE